MTSPNYLFLDETYIIDGVKVTGKDIKEHIIDSLIYRQHIKELMEESEWVSITVLNHQHSTILKMQT